MPTINYTYTVPYVAETSKTTTRIMQLPVITECFDYPLAGWINERSEGWNCTFCPQDSPYYSRYQVGDIIPFMLRLPDRYNTDIANPTVGWNYTGAANFYVKASLYGAGNCVAPIFTVVDDFCADWWVSYTDKIGAHQTLFVDTQLIATAGYTDFRLLVEFYDSTNTKIDEVWSENFVQIDCEKFSFLIDSYYNTQDCFLYDYASPAFAERFGRVFFHQTTDPVGYQPTRFSLKRRYLGQVVFDSDTAETTTDDKQNILKQDIIKTFKINFEDFLPPYESQILAAQIRGNDVFIDNVQYTNFGQLSRNTEQGLMFIVRDLTCQQICRISNRVCG